MTSVGELIREVESVGAIFSIEGEQLKLIRGKLLHDSLLERARASKPEILEALKRDTMAREAWFLSLHIGEVYARQTADNAYIFVIVNESGKWDAWRETWGRGDGESNSKPKTSIGSKRIATNVTFELAMLKSKQYIENLSRWKGATSNEPAN